MLGSIEMERPIGYWLKHLDRLIEEAFEQALRTAGLTRRPWQAMNVMHESPQDAAALVEAMRRFWRPGAITVDETTDELTRSGWVARDASGRYALTSDGEAGHAAVQEKVHAVRNAILDGLTNEEYRATVRPLQKMSENLERKAGLFATASEAPN
jgi:hypothetical protein